MLHAVDVIHPAGMWSDAAAAAADDDALMSAGDEAVTVADWLACSDVHLGKYSCCLQHCGPIDLVAFCQLALH